MLDDANAANGTVRTVPATRRCDFCETELPPARNHNGITPRFCSGSRCRSGWHQREKQRIVEAIHQGLEHVRGLVDQLLKK